MMTKKSAQHSQASVEHYSPLREMIDPARRVTGPFDLDPFSCPLANETVQARRIITASEDGFRTPWFAHGESGGAWINPPGGTDEGSNQGQAWRLTARNWLDGSLRWAWFVVFNPSCFYQPAREYARSEGLPVPQDFPRCEFAKRVRYLHPADERQPGLPEFPMPKVVPGTQPPHGSALLFLPATWEQAGLFREVFDPELGDVVIDPYRLRLAMDRRDARRETARRDAPVQGRLFE